MIMVVLAVFAILFIVAVLGPEGLLQKVKDMSNEVFGMVPNAPQKAPPQGEIPRMPELEAAFNRLTVAMDKDYNGPCIIDWKDTSEKDKGKHLPSGFDGFTITFDKKGDGTFYAQLLSKDKIVVDTATVAKELCVVGGGIYGSDITVKNPRGEAKVIASRVYDGTPSIVDVPAFLKFKEHFPIYESLDMHFIAAQNFYTNWIEDIPPDATELKSYGTFRRAGEKIISQDYTNPTSVEITDDDEMSVYYGKDKKEWGKEDNGLLYVPERGKVCWFATFGFDSVYDCNALSKGLDEDCFDDANDMVRFIQQC